MTRRKPILVLALLLFASSEAGAQTWRAGMDARIELMSILFRLAGNSEYRQSRIPQYDRAIGAYFAPYRDHPAVQAARLMGVGFEAPMKLAAYLRDAATLEERVPFGRLTFHFWENWDAAKARDFLGATRDFATTAKFADFLQSQQPLYKATNARLLAFLQSKADLDWIERFFGPMPRTQLVIVPGLANGAASYAARFIDETGAQEIYAIPGVSKVDSQGLPVFDADWEVTMIHELAQVYVSPAVVKFSPQMEGPAGRVYRAVAPAMRRQSCPNWKAMLNESRDARRDNRIRPGTLRGAGRAIRLRGRTPRALSSGSPI